MELHTASVRLHVHVYTVPPLPGCGLSGCLRDSSSLPPHFLPLPLLLLSSCTHFLYGWSVGHHNTMHYNNRCPSRQGTKESGFSNHRTHHLKTQRIPMQWSCLCQFMKKHNTYMQYTSLQFRSILGIGITVASTGEERVQKI